MVDAPATLASIEMSWLQHPDQLFEYEFVNESIARFYEAEEPRSGSFKVFSIIAIAIGYLGLYGLVSF